MSPTYRLALTGSVGMGKSTTARLFEEAGVPVWDADATVHRLYAPGGGAVAEIEALRPEAVADGGVSRPALKDWIAEEPDALDRIEARVHPLVAAERAAFLERHAAAPLVLLDIPLLFETGGEDGVDGVAVVTAPPEVQRARVLARPGMTEEAFATILARQVPDAEKRRRADFLVQALTIPEARRQVRAVVAQIEAERGHA